MLSQTYQRLSDDRDPGKPSLVGHDRSSHPGPNPPNARPKILIDYIQSPYLHSYEFQVITQNNDIMKRCHSKVFTMLRGSLLNCSNQKFSWGKYCVRLRLQNGRDFSSLLAPAAPASLSQSRAICY